jgi:hypothetical protein
MENIDPVFLLQPALVFAACLGVVFYWNEKKTLRPLILALSAVSYFATVIPKNLIIGPTLGPLDSAFGSASLQVGLYLGTMTAVFEIGGAYYVARVLARRGMVGLDDAAGYGIGLGFWENGIYLGLLSLANLAAIYTTIAWGALPASAYGALTTADPSLFSGAWTALPLIALGSLERLSSLLAHISWGYLCVLSACTNRMRYFLMAFPMGYVDALVPFAGEVPLWEFEGVVFLLSVVFLAIAVYSRPRTA